MVRPCLPYAKKNTVAELCIRTWKEGEKRRTKGGERLRKRRGEAKE
jgi:hypothetical protein